MINLYHLKYFCDTYKTSSLTRAAEMNHVSVPTVSHAIKSLERTLDKRLLLHGKNTLKFSEAAVLLYHDGLELLSKAHETVTGESELKIRLATSHSIFCHYIVPRFKKSFQNQKNMEIKMANSRKLKQLFEDKQIDFGLSIPDRHLNGLDREILRKGKFVLVEATNCQDKDLYLVGDEGVEVDAFYDRYKKTLKKNPENVLQVEGWTGTLEMVEAGIGRGLVPDFMIEKKKNLLPVLSEIKLPSYELALYYLEENQSEFRKKLVSTL